MRRRLQLYCAAAALCAVAGQPLRAQAVPPTQIAWQRTLEDALALVEVTGRPLLVIANDPNEPLSNRLAHRIYKTEEFVSLTRGFICVLASPHEDSQPEYDSRGRRRPSSLYGQVLKREYTQIEPKLFERYFDGTRVAPRHLGVSPDGEILFDIYLTNDVSQITGALRKHGKPDLAMPSYRSDDIGVMESPANRHRSLVEELALETGGDVQLRSYIMEHALPTSGTRHPDVIRLGLRDADPGVRLAAAKALASGASLDELEFLPAAVLVFDEQGQDIAPLLARFDQVATQGQDTRPAWADATRTQTHRLRGLHDESDRLDQTAWLALLTDAAPPAGSRWAGTAPATDRDTLDRRLGELEDAMKNAEGTDIPLRRLDWIEATLEYARAQLRDGADPSFSLSDCVATGTDLLDVPAVKTRAACIVSVAGFLNGDARALDASFTALDGVLGESPNAPAPNSRIVAEVLDTLSNLLRSEIYRSSDQRPAPETLALAGSVCRLLPLHPLATLDQGLACADFFSWSGARADEAAVTEALLRRFPSESRVHDRLRAQRLRDRGPAELHQTYEAWIAQQTPNGEQALATAEWFAGVASVQIASTWIVDGRPEAAVTSARSALDRLDTSMRRVPGFADSANHWAVFAHSAEARAQLDLGALDAAAEAAIASLQRRPASASIDDWLGTNPKVVAEQVASALDRAGRSDDAKSLRKIVENLASD